MCTKIQLLCGLIVVDDNALNDVRYEMIGGALHHHTQANVNHGGRRRRPRLLSIGAASSDSERGRVMSRAIDRLIGASFTFEMWILAEQKLNLVN